MIKHIPVLPDETIQYLAPSKNQNFIDATCGFGGHSGLILKKNGPKGRLLAIDQDKVALYVAQKNLKNFSSRVDFVQSNFTKLGLIIRSWHVPRIDGILFDLGVSTYQLKSPGRGFSFSEDSELDMRMAPEAQTLSAKEIVNSWSEKKLKEIFQKYGEEQYAGKIAQVIVKTRTQKPISTTSELVEIIKKATPPKYRTEMDKHFATKIFQALRIAVNDELKALESGLKQALQILSHGGRLVVISFHSLEDRIVKNFFRENNLEILTPKPIVASQKEIIQNPSARSAKLRVAIKNI
ncbi:MAG: Ribosomal RNA small subunit methyltransferase H [Berkelbacteria bacterium GW2011_GWA1_36_9]|uniref:Ribosomal RNA small subunit methyltransferase H n=1 Tax=Berkelbacteria bacterium GW2011_GWA1_36_9 TaxID=1618331 RepID=A0A0G0FIJ2_9BACT|nr:MAG: Ribosomal RNA small subunit methyltransferase H [Berkelbacteria bacterium GW2011_GWA1_36_9]